VRTLRENKKRGRPLFGKSGQTPLQKSEGV
jgi:hypothetical protein